MKLKFLGTGGGRYVTGEQRRRTAGIIIKTEESRLHLDPGPGALVYNHQEIDKPLETDGVIVSHAHLDHSSDTEAIIEMMTEAGDKPGALFANKTVLEGHGDIDKRISSYHQNLCLDVEKLKDGFETKYKDLKIRSQEMFHSDPRTQGLILSDEDRSIGFWTDTEFSEELTDFYKGCDTLVIYCTRPKGKSISSHTSVNDVPDIVEHVDPSTVIITHFGYAFLKSDMDEQKNWLDEQVDCKVIFAEDNMEFPGNRSLAGF
jgi:ribonuclease BN (tRNA processing enzyme)